MTAKQVLSKVAAMLSLTEKETVEFTDAKTADGTILQSPTFDLGEAVEVVSEDGTKTPAPDGEYEIALKDTEGKEVVIRIEVKDGKVNERENVEEAQPEVPEESESEVETETEMEGEGDTMMAKEDIKDVPAHSLPNTTDEDPRNRVGSDTDDLKDPIIALSYRITELEDAIAELKMKFGEAKTTDETAVVKGLEMEEVEVPKLDGAPVEELSKVNLSAKTNNRKVEGNYQSSFLSKLYK